MKNLITLLALYCLTIALHAQGVGVNKLPAASAALDVSSTSKGMLVPGMTATQRNSIATPLTALMVFDITLNGFYFNNGTAWVGVGTPAASQLPNASLGHPISTGGSQYYTTPFVVNMASTLVAATSYYINTSALLNLTFYSLDDEAITFELFQVTPVTATTYATTGSALASCNTGGWTSRAPITASFSYAASGGNI